MIFNAHPIGYFHSAFKEKYMVPRQANLVKNEGVIHLNSHCNFEQALEGLEAFDRIWIIFWFHATQNWKTKVLPPRGHQKQGVFATRSPHRPNFIGLSCVELKAIQGLKVFIANHDLIDGTPILDIKPYLNYADAHSSSHQGWLDHLPAMPTFEVIWSPLAEEQIHYLQVEGEVDLAFPVQFRLESNPFPYPNHRIKQLVEGQYELAYKTWRIRYEVKEYQVYVLWIRSGYDRETLKGEKMSKWQDVPLHQNFQANFFTASKEFLTN